MLSKDKFIEVIEHIKEHQKLESNLCASLEAMSDSSYCDTFIYSKYETLVVELLKEALGLDAEVDIIEYFMYELDFGANYEDECFIESDGTSIDLSTASALYDYLEKYYLCK